MMSLTGHSLVRRWNALSLVGKTENAESAVTTKLNLQLKGNR
jgi:hypothetical protein